MNATQKVAKYTLAIKPFSLSLSSRMTSWLDFYASFLSMSPLCMPSWAAKFDPGEVLVQN